MRVSTATIYDQGVFNIQRNQSELLKVQEQVSTGRRVLTPADDPVSASRALEVSQSKAITAQFARNTESATAAIGLTENSLQRYTTLLQDVKVLAVNAGNGSLTPNDRKSIATELRERYGELLGIANTTDSNGLFLFSGYRGATQPFTETAPGTVAYNGDQGSREIQIGASAQVAVSAAGSEVFQRIRTGNGTFQTAAGAANTGTGVVDAGVVRDATAWAAPGNPGSFEVRFFRDSAVPSVTTYDIVDTVNNLSLTTGAAPAAGPYLRTFQPGAAIVGARQTPPDTNPAPFDFGFQLSVQGQPATGDAFSVTSSTEQDVFSTVWNLIQALESSQAGATGATRVTNAVNTALTELDNALEVNLTVRAGVGARMRQIDTAKSGADDLQLQYERTLSQLTDLDYNKAISELTFQQVSLEAAQKSFLRVQGLSLFQFL
jgi:flagellar hook-associated protein 3 FlgL